METKNHSCISDIPLDSQSNDSLGAVDYAKALFNFIIDSTSPITIGIQGDWGSGKTSLITLLQEDFENDKEHRVLCVLVNAWQLSLLQSDGGVDSALSLLEELAKGIHIAAANSVWLDESIKKQLGVGNEKLDNVLRSIKSGLNTITRVGAQAALNMLTHSSITALNPSCNDNGANGNISESIRNLKDTLINVVKICTQTGVPEKIVFFIDDLDRVTPQDAVGMLDIVKNIFDIPNCVFVLTIDYDVVVIGLESKFGPKTPENERAFRQYFDKIIQIPFLMPIGTYGDGLPSMLKHGFIDIGINVDNMGPEFFNHLAEDGRLATGGNPRSIKRIINTLSLLRYIYLSRLNREEDKYSWHTDTTLEALFIVMALHINFPEISAKLMENSNFMDWTLKNMNFAWKLNAERIQDDMAALNSNEFFDDDWEKVVYCLCNKSSWLKSKAHKISMLMNRLGIILDENGRPDPKELTPKGLILLNHILDSIRVVSLSSDVNIRDVQGNVNDTKELS